MISNSVIAKEQSDCGNPEDWCTNAHTSRSDFYCGDRHATLAMTCQKNVIASEAK